MVTIKVSPPGAGTVQVQASPPVNGYALTKFTAIPAAGYKFDHFNNIWPNGTLDSPLNPWTDQIKASGGDNVTAYFVPAPAPQPPILNVQARVLPAGKGTVSVNGLSTTDTTTIQIPQGGVVNITATPNAGYRIVNFSEGAQTWSNISQYIIPVPPGLQRNMSWTVTFEPITTPPPPPSGGTGIDWKKILTYGGGLLFALGFIESLRKKR